MKELMKIIEDQFEASKIKWKEALYPILDIEDEKLRSLFIVSIGCDVFKGIHGVTPRWINDVYNEVVGKENIYFLIMKAIMKKDKKGYTADVLNAFVSSFMHEPAVEFGQKDNPTAYKFLFGTQKSTKISRSFRPTK